MRVESEVSRARQDARPPAEEIRAYLAKVLLSRGFVRSDRISALLSYLVERRLSGSLEPPKESVVGVEVFARAPGYDTQADPVVRVTARRLREKLDEYYRGSGAADPVRIELPTGRYAVEFAFQVPGGPNAPPSAAGIEGAMAHSHSLVGSGKALFDWFQAGPHAARRRRSCGQPGAPSHPAFSPDGQALAFDWRGPEDDAERIYVQLLEADRPACFSRSGVKEVRPVWSPDGGRIAYVRHATGGQFEIWTAPVLGIGDRLVAQVSSHSGEAPRAEWSPDSKVMVTSGCTGSGTQDALMLFLAEGGRQQQITAPPAGAWGDDEAVFSPDGRMLAFRRRTGPRKGDVYLHPMTSGAAALRLTWDECEICGFAWAPGGRNLIVASRREGGFPALWRVPLTRDPPVRLTVEGDAVSWPTVSPRKDRLAFVRYAAGQLPGGADSKGGEIVVVEDFS